MAGPLCARPPEARARWRVRGLLTVLAVLAGGGFFACAPAFAQQLAFPERAPLHQKSRIEREREKQGAQKQMLVQANEIDYDYTNKRRTRL